RRWTVERTDDRQRGGDRELVGRRGDGSLRDLLPGVPPCRRPGRVRPRRCLHGSGGVGRLGRLLVAAGTDRAAARLPERTTRATCTAVLGSCVTPQSAP